MPGFKSNQPYLNLLIIAYTISTILLFPIYAYWAFAISLIVGPICLGLGLISLISLVWGLQRCKSLFTRKNDR